MKTIGIILLFLSVLTATYALYQLIRNEFIYRIRVEWIKTDDKRWYKYSYDFMFEPSSHNWFGLKFPTEKDFPF